MVFMIFMWCCDFLVFIFIPCAICLVVGKLITIWFMLKLRACGHCQADYKMKCGHEVPWVNNEDIWHVNCPCSCDMKCGHEVLWWNDNDNWHVNCPCSCDMKWGHEVPGKYDDLIMGTRCRENIKNGLRPVFTKNMKTDWDPYFYDFEMRCHMVTF